MNMDMKKQYISLIAICASIIIGASIIAYKPQKSMAREFRFPVGIPSSLGTVAATWIGEEQVNTLSLSGAGSASARANEATLTVGVQTDNPYASEAVTENAEKMTTVIGAIKALGISEDDIETISYGVNPVYDSDWKQVIGYRVTNLVRVKISDLSMVGDVIDEASEAGANRIEGVSFGLSDDLAEELKFDAYRLALNDAGAKADVIAEVLDLELTGVLYVSESTYYPYRPSVSYEAVALKVPAPTPILEGSLSVTVTVQVVYTFQ